MQVVLGTVSKLEINKEPKRGTHELNTQGYNTTCDDSPLLDHGFYSDENVNNINSHKSYHFEWFRRASFTLGSLDSI